MHTLELSFPQDIQTQTLKDIAAGMGYEVEARAFDAKGTGAHFGLSNGHMGVFFIVAAKTARRVMFMLEDGTPTWVFDEVLRFVTVLQDKQALDLHVGDETFTALPNAAMIVTAKLYWRETRPEGYRELSQEILRAMVAWNSKAHRHAAEYNISVAPMRLLECDGRMIGVLISDKEALVPAGLPVLFVNEEGRGKIISVDSVDACSSRIHSDSLSARLISESQMKMLAEIAKNAPGQFVAPSELRVVETMRTYARKPN